MSFAKRLARVAKAGVKDVFRRVDQRARALEDWVDEQTQHEGQQADANAARAAEGQREEVDPDVVAQTLDDLAVCSDSAEAADAQAADESPAPEVTRKRMGPQ